MRRIAIAILVLLIHAAPAAQVAQSPAIPDDGIARLLLDLERSLTDGRVDEFRALAAGAISQAALNQFTSTARSGAGSRAVVRERIRRATGTGYDVVADVLVSKDGNGRVATWLLLVEPDAAAPRRFKVADVRELAGFDGLLKLRLDTVRQFSVKGLVINGPDMKLTMTSGSAFVAESPNGVTGLVLRGRGEVEFTPSDPAEQLQLRIFSHRTVFRTDIDSVFVRLNPGEYAQRVVGELTPMPVNQNDVARAQLIFDDYASRTYTLDLRALTTERWSIEPPRGSLVIEFRTNRHGWLTYTRSPVDIEDISLFDRAGGHNICQYSSAGRLAGDQPGADGSVYDVEHYSLDLAFDPSRLWITGRAAMRVRMTETTSTVTLKLAQTLGVASVTSPELGELLAIRVVGQNNVLIGLPAPARENARFTFEVAYSGRLPAQSIDREAIAPQGTATQTQPQQTEDERLIITPEPRFMYSNGAPWYPQGVSPDYATADLRFSVPAEYQIVASGRMVGSSVSEAPRTKPSGTASGAIRTAEFVADRPVRYIACLFSRLQPVGQVTADVPMVAPATRATATAPPTSVNIEVLATPRMVGRNRQTPGRTATMLQFYSKLIGEAPYPNLTLAALDDNLPGGHSPGYFVALHQALPTTPYSWAADPVAFENQYPHFFLAHEIAHQWWGQAVGWRNYHEQWLSEGLSQYFAVLFAAEERGPAMLQSLISTMRETSQPVLGQGPISLGYRVGHIKNDGRAFRSIMYNKAAVVLHMLRRFIGDDAFFRGLRRFYTDWRFRKAGTEDLRAAFESVTPLKLDRFFEQWVRGFTVPRISLTWSSQDEGKTGVIRVDQAGTAFDFPLTVVLQFADGRSEERTLSIVGAAFEERMTVASPLRKVTIRDSLSYYETR